MHRRLSFMHLPLVAMVAALVFSACASIGRPEGGAKDEIPPKFVSSNPAPGAVDVNRTRLSVNFDENIQLEDAFTKVVVSPAQKQPPQVSANGKRLSVELRDTLRPNTTYTIDFADAIKDLNEGNILDGFALDFSTGPTIDTLRISGMVLQAKNLEPAQGMLVGVYSNLSDTAIRTLPLERIARTNQLGQFTIRGLKPGNYRVYAVNDLNRDYHWDRSEDVAFYDYTVSPSVESIQVSDTLWASDRSDSIVTHEGIRFLPNDVLMTWFNEEYLPQYLKDYARPDRRRITVNFAAPSDSLPEIRIVSGAPGVGREISEWGLLRSNATRDTLEYWISDTSVVASDSLMLSMRYLKTDTTDNLVWTTDTLRFFFKDPNRNKKKKKEKKEVRVDSLGDTIPEPVQLDFLSVRVGSNQQDLNRPLLIDYPQPLASLDSAALRLEVQRDTVWEEVRGFRLQPDSINPLLRSFVDIKWEPGAKYRFTADSLAFMGIYNEWNKPIKTEFTARQLEDYSSVVFNIVGLDSLPAVVELLSSSDEPVYRASTAKGSNVAELRYLTPGAYFARLFIDRNGNGKWDTGSIADSIQPEEVYYYPKKLQLKKNWDVEQTWDIFELPLDLQKPWAIKKNKPKLKNGEKAPGEEEEEEEDFYDPSNPFGGGNPNPFDNKNNNRRPGGGVRPGGIRPSNTGMMR